MTNLMFPVVMNFGCCFGAFILVGIDIKRIGVVGREIVMLWSEQYSDWNFKLFMDVAIG